MPAQTENIQSRLQRIRLRIVLFGLSTVAGMGLLLVFIPVDEKVNAGGVVHAEEESYLRSPMDGLLTTIAVHEGERVVAGQVLGELDAVKVQGDLKMAEARIRQARAELDLRRKRLQTVLKLPLPKEFWHLAEDLEVARKKKEQTAVDLQRIDSLGTLGAVSKHYIETARLAAALAAAELQRVERKEEIVEQGLEETILNEARAEVRAAEENLRILEVERTTLQAELERHVIRAPGAGQVTLITRRMPGERVTRGEDLFHVAHGQERSIRLLATEREYHRIRVGQRVRMTSPAFDSLRHGYIEGVVTRAAIESEQRDPGTPVRTYRVKVKVEHTPQPLMLGTSVDAQIILRRTPLWQLLLPSPVEPVEAPQEAPMLSNRGAASEGPSAW